MVEHFLRWWTNRRPAERLALVCADRQELVSVREIARPYGIPVLHLPDRAELSLLREACKTLSCDTIGVLPLTLPLLPASFLQRLWYHHAIHGNALTEAVDAPEGALAYIISSELLGLIGELNSDLGVDVRKAAHACHDASRLLDGINLSMKPFRLCDEYGVSRTQIPKRASLDSRDTFNLTAQYIVRASQVQDDTETFRLLSEFRASRIHGVEQEFEWCRRPFRRQERGPEPIRVLYVSTAAGYSGAEDSLVRMIAKLDRNRVRAYACVSRSGVYTERLSEAGATVNCPERNFGQPRLPNLKYLMDLISEVNPHCVHLNGSCGGAVQIAAGLSSVPVVQHLRSSQVREMADSLALSAAVVAVSDYVRGQVAQSVDVDLAKVHVVYDGVDTLLFAPGIMSKQAARERLGIPADSKVVLMVARYWPNKRHDLLLQALSQVRGSCPETELLLVGEPDHRQPAYYDRVQHMISELRLEGSVRCLGFQRDIRWAECAADVQVLCSEHEPLGTCILESMALGVPVIISRGSGLSEIVVDGEHGFVVPQGDSAVLAGRLVELLSHEGMRQTFGRQARRLIESRFTAQACADSITAIYQGMCGRSEDRLRQ